MTLSLAVLFSGGGRTVLNLLDHIDRGELDAMIQLAIASRSNISGIEKLKDRGLDVVVARENNETLEVGDLRVKELLETNRPDVICLCGYLRLLEIQGWMQGRVLNIHPALLPKYGGQGMYGMRVHESVIANGETHSGCTVHYVDEEYDHGPTILQRTCDVRADEDAKTLAQRVFSLECEAYPTAIKMVAEELTV